MSPYSPAKSVLRRSATSEIVGREKELGVIGDFMNGEQGLLYVCGPPGTGKSATVTQYTSGLVNAKLTRGVSTTFRTVNVNCVSLQRPDHVYSHILRELGREGTTIDDLRDTLDHLEERGTQVVLVLDEVDYLISNHSKVMYSLFELGTSFRLKMIGIANALNLTDSMLPHLRRTGIEPTVLRFKPYSPAEITDILAARVAYINLPTHASKLIEKTALDFLGRKVANATGDIRKALDILRKSIEIVESEYRSALSDRSVNTPAGEHRLAPVTIRHIAKVAAQALGGGVTGASLVAGLSIHEKAVLCTMMVRKTRTLSATFDAYVALCRRDKMLSPLPRTEIATVVAGMLDNSVLAHPTRTKQGVVPARSGSLRAKSASSSSSLTTTTMGEERIVLGVSEMDVLKGIGDAGILKRFFDA